MILSFLRKLDTLRVFTESGIEFKIVTPILVRLFHFLSSGEFDRCFVLIFANLRLLGAALAKNGRYTLNS